LDNICDIPNNAIAILSEGKTIAECSKILANEAKRKSCCGNYVMLTPNEGINIALKYFGINKRNRIA
jgi:hypothetical protein